MLLYNSLTRKNHTIHPVSNNTIRMYVCGVTPYDTTHLGHAFVYLVFDVLKKYLEYKEYSVVYTQNVTDIDDDILLRARKEGRDWRELGETWTQKFLNDLSSLNIDLPTNYVKATDSIPTIIEFVQKLISNGYAYDKEGTVYFDVESFPRYGELSLYAEREMIELSRERGANPDDPLKKNPLDFILWQKSLEGEPFWESPWGRGRPGWHIECSAMIYETLGEQIDIHGGGFDLIYPHHESERAQSESFTGKVPFVQTWMHVGMLSYKGEKMSKSLGNLVLVSDLLKKYSSRAIRLMLLSNHYRVPWEFQEANIEQAEQIVKRIHFQKIQSKDRIDPVIEELIENDLNIPKALDIALANPEKHSHFLTLILGE